MNTQTPSLLVALISLGMVLYAGESSHKANAADKVDHSIYSHLLNKFVKNGNVDYRGFKEEEDEATTSFINNPERNNLNEKTLYTSKIFDWFEKDFNGDVPGFFRKYAKGELAKRLEKEKKGLRIKYLEYDWSLNGK